MDSVEQQIVDTITGSSNILVTVSNSPTVDELSAALGLTLVLDKLDKRATAIFSGAIPPAITFLEPEKTFEGTADSLRDFIIALNKEKADHLRYKVDGDVVKIFITPYKTTLSQADLEFSQGDYNVELVLALGVKDQNSLDGALAAHGKILHDAKVMTITAGADKSTLGSADWHDDKASSLSEMITGLVNALKSEESLLDQQVSTALLTGIVSATDRFSNDRTSSQVMTLAAQLMGAGANQQLIAAKLQEGNALGPVPIVHSGLQDSEISSDGTELTIERDEKSESAASGQKVIEPPTSLIPPANPTPAIATEDADQLELEKQLAGITAAPTGTMADIEQQLQDAVESPAAEEAAAGSALPPVPSDTVMPDFEPTATPVAEPAPVISGIATPTANEEPASHTAPVGIISPDQQAMNGTLAPEVEEPIIDPLSAPDGITSHEGATIIPDTQPATGTAEGAALLAGLGEPTFPEPSAPVIPAAEPALTSEPELAMPELPPLPPLPPLPTDSSIPPLPPPPPPPVFSGQPAGAMPAGAVSGDVFGDTIPAAAPVETPAAPAPGQFKIPGQG